MDFGAWLRSLGLEQYEAVFRENAIDAEVLHDLTEDHLRELGLPLGARIKLLKAINALDPRAEDISRSVRVAFAGPPLDTAQRRQVTVMFSDLVGSTALSARMDPEDLREVISAYQKCVAATVRRFDGFVARYLGDGVLAYFGYPQAHEDDAERAVRAGLELIAALGALKTRAALQTRVGIATGLVVIGDLEESGEARERGIVGETPNLAARLQSIAEPNTVVIAEGTRRLLGNLFELNDLGARDLKGIPRPVRAWAALRTGSVESRFEALHASGLTALVGREEECESLLHRWSRAKTGEGQVVLLSGEPGIGKSRLTAALLERLASEQHTCLRYFCSPYYQDSALFPFLDQLGRAAGFGRDDTPAAQLNKLEALLAQTGLPEEDAVLLAEFMSLPRSERHPPSSLNPQRKKERTLEALIRQLEGLARRQPVVMIFEDAHWLDPTSRELLDLTVERIRSLPVLLVVTFRPESEPPWIGQSQVSVMALNRLNRHDQNALVEQIADGKALPNEILAQIVERADGVPLFLEELAKNVLESGLLRQEGNRYLLDGPLPPFAIPTTLHDSLMARLDRLGSVRQVAQIGAAIGREFSYGLLNAVSRVPDDEMQAALARLVASELVFQRGTPPDAVYSFKHALVQDAAHDSLLRSSRRQLHAQIVKALETDSPELMDMQPELFARHYAEAGFVEKSVACWGKAGQRSVARSAMTEAAAQLQKGLDQLALLPDTPERRRQELEFYSALGAVLLSVKGQAAPETGHAYARAQELWEQLGSPLEFLQVPYGVSRYHAIRGELDLAQRLEEDLLRLSRQRNHSAGLVLGHMSSGRNMLSAARLASSRWHLEEALALYDPVPHRPLVHQVGFHPHVSSQAYLGIVLFCLGFPDQAVAHTNAAIAEARRLAHPPSLALSLTLGTVPLWLVGDNAALDERAGELIAVATEQDFPGWGAQGTIFRGWVKVKHGDVTEGISLLRSGESAYRATGAEVWTPYYIGLLAMACGVAGKIEESYSLLDDALQIVERIGERWFAAELNRHKGRLLLLRGHSEAAEELYRKALSIAVEQQAKFWELRAAVSLARLRRDQDRHTEARDLLAPVYGWFTEGFDTLDLKQAKAMLSELAS